LKSHFYFPNVISTLRPAESSLSEVLVLSRSRISSATAAAVRLTETKRSRNREDSYCGFQSEKQPVVQRLNITLTVTGEYCILFIWLCHITMTKPSNSHRLTKGSFIGYLVMSLLTHSDMKSLSLQHQCIKATECSVFFFFSCLVFLVLDSAIMSAPISLNACFG